MQYAIHNSTGHYWLTGSILRNSDDEYIYITYSSVGFLDFSIINYSEQKTIFLELDLFQWSAEEAPTWLSLLQKELKVDYRELT